MKPNIYALFLLLMAVNCNALVTIQASTLNCTIPLELNESAIIQLDVPIIISGPNLCELITAGAGFGANDTVTFQATQANTITLTSDTTLSTIGTIEIENAAMWDMRSFDQTTQKFIFEDIQITMEPGTGFIADGLTIQLIGTSKLITQAVAQP